MNFSLIVRIIGFLYFSNIFAAQVSFTCENGQFNIVGSNLKQSRSSWQVNIYVNDNFKNSVNSQSNSFSYTLDASDNEGSRVKVQINEYDSGSHKIFTKTVNCRTSGGGNSGGGNSGGGSNGGGSVDTGMSDSQIRNYADQQARTVANNVVKIYGKLEAWKKSFVRGFWRGFESYQLDPWRYAGASNGERDGRTAGITGGTSAGFQAAQSLADDRAKTDAKSRFVAIVDSRNSPDTSIQLPSTNYPGADAGLNNINMDSVWTELDASLQQELRRLSFSDESLNITYDYWTGRYSFTIRDVYGYGRSDGYSLVDSWFRADSAWDEWRFNRLGGRYDANLYNGMSYSEQQRFESQFRSIYDSVIDGKMNDVRSMVFESAYERGRYYGERAGEELAYKSGYNRGYNNEFRSSSINEFNRQFEGLYRSAFNTKVDYYNSNSVISEISVRMIDGNRNSAFEHAENVGVEISRLVNIGRQPLTLANPRLIGDSLEATLGTQVIPSLEIAPSSTLTTPVRFENLAKLKAAAPSEQNLNAELVFSNNIRKSLSFKISFEDIATAFSQTSPADYTQRLYITSELRKEFDAAMSSGSTTFPKLAQVIRVKSSSTTKNFVEVYKKLFPYVNGANDSGWGSGKKKVKQEYLKQVAKISK